MVLLFLLGFLVLCSFSIYYVDADNKAHFDKKTWDMQFAKGKWDYLAQQSVEIARLSVIVSVFANRFALNGTILDVGCGEGALADFLNDDQKKLYLGIDLSSEAIKKGKKRTRLNFLQTDAEKYLPLPGHQANVIVFSEMLYYMDHLKILNLYSGSRYLAKDGIIVISLWSSKNSDYLKDIIYLDAKRMFESVDFIDLSGITGPSDEKKFTAYFHIEGFRLKKDRGNS
jgi:SAM-dependent methyltransferase